MVDITSLTTLHPTTKADSIFEIHTEADLQKAITSGIFTQNFLILGHGANVLFTKDFPGTVVLNRLESRPQVEKEGDSLKITAGSGFSWHNLVTFTVKNNWSGLENMALIPGTVGAAVVGNIAAYGQNQEDVFDSLTAIDLTTGKSQTFTKSDLHFDYRDSLLKHEFKDHYFITSVTYQLSPTPKPSLSYHDRFVSLETELAKFATVPYSISDIYTAVINIRTAKLPDPEKVGTAGSFFKNPTISKAKALELQKTIPELQIYPVQKLNYDEPASNSDMVKIPAGRLLDFLGWKGKTIGKVSTSSNQALCLVNLGGATGAEIYSYSENMRADVKSHFDIDLEYEVVIV